MAEPLNPDTWLIVPLYNEGPVVGDVIRHARERFAKIVCVDDGSSDGSGGVAEAAGAVVVTHPVNLGQGAALQTGLRWATGDPAARYFVTFDSDGQHRTEDAQRMVERLRTEELDVVLGSRFLEAKTEAGLMKRLVLRAAVLFERMTTGLKVTDTHNGLRALSRHAAETIRIRQNRMAHGSEILHEIAHHRLRYAEEPVHIVYTDYSRAKGQSLWNSVNILNELIFDRGVAVNDQLLIQILLILALVVLMVALLVQRPGARSTALRRLAYLFLLVAAIAAVIYPEWLTWVASLFGIGRGVDLLLYGLILVFISHSIASKSRHAATDRRFTDLARHVAISEAEPAEAAGRRLAGE